MFLVGIILLLMLPVLYKRYVPVVGAEEIQCNQNEDVQLVDVRDFHEANRNPVSSAIHIPLPYLARQHNEIADKEVIVIVSDKVLRNLSIRQLKKYGFKVKGYCCKKEAVYSPASA
ncbi:rhodanese-like domain-containing protein [Bacillus badius]|uniref:Rhodanese domain-containing protein n=1 Tax=Bacillus badius TaxID=1455 RepID=A0ABR5AZZ4_BACBA|nr:rhodanese-like domain-containing protein [Bacillus badius]KIL73250.1 hypothetical protein SD78_3438 [Bacillus badius]KIL80262.1 hypothetical protein SD77_0110 [Bacillus badius]MED0667026.1 rhodanese-like domain-containing protein [Bacillus badius]MED4716966.1 rhodanese-like domain-containing protein [Bacillus badius]TDW05660.1 rhodanese-related sulfurtransferase [Bacillus badius]